MDKSEFVNELVNQTGHDEEKCNKINSIIEDTFIMEKMLKKFQTELGFSEEEANKLYEIAAKILCNE